jgi:hypothetical protein
MDVVRLDVRSLDEVKETAHSWLVYGFLPWGNVVVLEGDPGTNKSTLAVAIAAAVTVGHGTLFGQAVKCDPGRTLFIAPEDSISATLKPRLIAAGADTRKIDYLKSVMLADGNPDYLDLGKHLRELEGTIVQRQLKLVCIDPLLAHFGEVESKDEKGCRQVILGLQGLCERLRIIALGIRHFNKQHDNANKKYRGMGSIAITGTARSVLHVEADANDAGYCRVATQTKVNIARSLATCRFRIAEKIIDTPDGPNETVYIAEWSDAEIARVVTTTNPFADAVGPNGIITIDGYAAWTGVKRDTAARRLQRGAKDGHLMPAGCGGYKLSSSSAVKTGNVGTTSPPGCEEESGNNDCAG